jgi:hypothetical protein
VDVKPKKMKKSNPKFLLVLIISLFVSLFLCSCNKDNINFNGTIWESGSFESDLIADSNYGGEYILKIEKVTITFKKENVSISVKISEIYDPVLLTTYSGFTEISGSGNYEYDEKEARLLIHHTGPLQYDSRRSWIGTVDKNTMTLSSVFGKSVKFKKK